MDRPFNRPDKYHMKEIKMEKSNETGDNAVKKAGASQADKAIKRKQAKKPADKPKPAAGKAMASGDQTPAKDGPGKQSESKAAESAKDDSAKKKLAGEQVKPPEKEAEKTPSVNNESASKQKADEKTAVKLTGKAEDTADTAPSAFSKKMDEVKEVASVIGQQIAKAANYVNDKSEIIEDAIEAGLHQMKKDIHRVAENIVEKTKE